MNILAVRKTLGRQDWSPPGPYGLDGWWMASKDGDGTILVSVDEYDAVEWVHASMTRRASTPSYEDLVLLHRAVFGEHGWSYQVFTPDDRHVNIHARALHLWGRLDGQAALPDFARGGGSI